jgi:hypothetical protein
MPQASAGGQTSGRFRQRSVAATAKIGVGAFSSLDNPFCLFHKFELQRPAGRQRHYTDMATPAANT